ncbi:DUF2207 domain-containing protein [Planococcus lenghuensis]
MNEDGTADISEHHTYEFDGEFNGIIRHHSVLTRNRQHSMPHWLIY